MGNEVPQESEVLDLVFVKSDAVGDSYALVLKLHLVQKISRAD